MTRPATVPESPSSGHLQQILGLAFGWAVTVGGTISMGILRTPREVATQLPDGWLYLGAWLLGGLYALLGAISVAELSALYPRSGGPFVLARRVLGPYPGFLVGWSDWLNWSGTCASTALVLGEYSGKLFPALAGHDRLVGLVLLLGVVLLQWRGLREGSAFQTWTSLLKGLAFLALIACCLVYAAATGAPGGEGRPAPSGLALAGAVVLAMQGVMYTYSGWEITTYFGEEMKDPRLIPRSMIGSTLIVAAIYVLFNIALLAVLPVAELAQEELSAAPAARAVFGAHGETVIRVLSLISLLAGLSAAVLLTPRILLALAREGLFFPQATHVNQGGTPDVALLLSAGAAVLLLFSGTFERLLAILATITVANYAMLFVAVFVSRWTQPQAVRPYRAWGYPWTPALALLGSVVFLVGAVLADPDTTNSLYALALWVLSVPVFLLVWWLKGAGTGDSSIPPLEGPPR